jgi:hypothetical protein
VRSLGRLRSQMDHSCLTMGRGALGIGRSTEPAQGVSCSAPRCPVYLVQSAARRIGKLQGARVRVPSRSAPNRNRMSSGVEGD